jgi:predicted metal-dependent peptidase
MSKRVIDAVSKAKATLLTKRKPFYTICAMRLKFIPIPKDDPRTKLFQFQTMCTDGHHIFYNVEWTEKLSKEQLIGVICHEVMHVVLLHSFRLGGRIHLIWNIACDFAINITLQDDGFELPEGGCINEKYRDWSADKIYSDLMQNSKKEEQERPDWGEVIKPEDGTGKPLSEAEVRDLETETKIMIQAAAEAAKAVGNLPGSIQEIVDQYTKPVVHWQDYIPNWLLGSQPDDFSWRKPNRKWLKRGIYMPSVSRHGAGNGALMIDTSGSVSTPELQRYLSEIIGLIEDCAPQSLIVLPCDTEIKNVFRWEPGDEFQKLEVTGRGGTAVTPPFKWVEDNKEPVDWAIYFTDLEVYDFPEEPPYPVLWLTTGAEKAPWGRVIPCHLN